MSAAARATSLLTDEAMSTCLAGTAARTVEVRGATVTARPRPKTGTPGEHLGHVVPGGADEREKDSRPAATQTSAVSAGNAVNCMSCAGGRSMLPADY